jgi:hypothetical protein
VNEQKRDVTQAEKAKARDIMSGVYAILGMLDDLKCPVAEGKVYIAFQEYRPEIYTYDVYCQISRFMRNAGLVRCFMNQMEITPVGLKFYERINESLKEAG